MKIRDINIGSYYRLKSHPKYAYAKAREILAPNEKENTNNYTVVKCMYVVYKYDTTGFIKYFRPADLIEEVSNDN